MSLALKDREKLILKAVVQSYIESAEPVGSRTIQRAGQLELSPATIRNVMADLEDMGLLKQPHTSAGRIPTDIGFRYYVDTILEVKTISGREKETIEHEFYRMAPEVEAVIKHSSRVLSSVSRHIGVVLAPKFSGLILNQLQFVRLTNRLFLAILVGKSGIVQNRIVEAEEDINQEMLDRFNRYLNDILEGLSISEIKVRIVEAMREEKNRFDALFSRALSLSQKVFEKDAGEDDVYVDGQVNLLDYPEFADAEAMKAIFRAFEDKSILVTLLDRTLSASGVKIFIGVENELAAMEGFTLIASRYSRGSKPLGTLGIIGPTRLNYSKVIPVVDYTAKLVSHLLDATL